MTTVLRPNLLAIPLGLAGLATCWSTAAAVLAAAAWPALVLWLLTAVTWAVATTAYAAQVLRRRRFLAEANDVTFGPFTALPAIVALLLAGALQPYARPLAVVVFGIGLVAILVIGGYLSGQWILSDLPLARWHPGYFIPTVAGGLVASAASATLGFPRLAQLMFGYGILCWIVLGSIILLRLFTQPPLPPALQPTLAIEVAPPAIAGSAWFAMNGGRADLVATGLAGYGLLMVLVQIRLVPGYVRLPLGLGTWTFTFSYAAVVAVGIRWQGILHGPGWSVVAYALLGLLTLATVLLTAWTVAALARGAFLPREPAPAFTP